MNIAINGFGRIGRSIYRIITSQTNHKVVAINDLSDVESIAYLLKYDTVMGNFEGDVEIKGKTLFTPNQKVKIIAEPNPSKLPWNENKVDIVIEATGIFRSKEQIANHINAGAKKVILTVPAKDEIDYTVVLGVNEEKIDSNHNIISNASCTTNCLAPMAKIIDENFGIVKGVINTIHAYTNDQEKDPDYLNAHSKSLFQVIKNSADGSSTDYGKYLEVFSSDKAFVNSFEKAIPIALLYRFTLLVLVIIFPLETFLLWWLPAKIGTVYTTVFFSYYPHQGTSTGRYKDTQFWSHWMPRFVNHSMQLHFIHHLHPSIGHFDEPKAIEALKPFLIARKVPGAYQIPNKVTLNPLIKI